MVCLLGLAAEPALKVFKIEPKKYSSFDGLAAEPALKVLSIEPKKNNSLNQYTLISLYKLSLSTGIKFDVLILSIKSCSVTPFALFAPPAL